MIIQLLFAKKHVLEEALKSVGQVVVSNTPSPCDLCIVFSSPSVEQSQKLGLTPLVFYVDKDPMIQDMDAFLYTPTNQYAGYKCILLPEIFSTSKSYLETRYPNVPIKTIFPILPLYPNKVFEGKRDKTEKINIFIRANNTNFSENAWRQLCIAEHMYHTNPELINDVYLFNVPTNKCAIDMYENLNIFKNKKLRTFIEFEPKQIVQHFSLQPIRSVYLMNSVSDSFDPLALYCLQNQLGVVHTSEYLQQNKLGKYYKSYDIDTAVSLLKEYSTDSMDTTAVNELCKKLNNTQQLIDTIKGFSSPLKTVKSTIYNPTDLSTPLVIGYDNSLGKEENCKYFMQTLIKNNWEYSIISVSDKWNGFNDKLKGYLSFLGQLPDDKIVVISDTRDVLCCRTSKQFMQGFKSKNSNFIASMELFCNYKFETNKDSEAGVPLTNYWNTHKPVQKPLRKFVNSGLLCGKVSAIKKFFVSAQNESGDQAALGKYMNTHPNEVFADTNADLLHTTTFGCCSGLLRQEVQKQDSPTFAELFGHGAFFLHIPGITNSVMGQVVTYKYAKAMLDLGASNEEIKVKNWPEHDFFGKFVDGSELIYNKE